MPPAVVSPVFPVNTRPPSHLLSCTVFGQLLLTRFSIVPAGKPAGMPLSARSAVPSSPQGLPCGTRNSAPAGTFIRMKDFSLTPTALLGMVSSRRPATPRAARSLKEIRHAFCL